MKTKLWSFSILFFFYNQCLAQFPSDIIVLEGSVIELTSDSQFELVPNARLTINEKVRFECDEEGVFSIRIPYVSEYLNIGIDKSSYEIIQPKDGRHFIETKITPNSKYKVLIVIINENADESIKLKIQDAQNEIEKLRNTNIYTGRQLQDLNKKFVDTIRIYQSNQQKYLNAIARLEADVSGSKMENKAHRDSINSLRGLLVDLQSGNDQLIVKLSAAMQQKYLKQKSHFEQVSSTLRLYISRAKDVRDHLQILESLIKSNQSNHYHKALNNYSKIYESLESDKDAYQNGIAKYWQSNQINEEFTAIQTFLFEDIHKDDFLGLNNSVNRMIGDAAEGKRLKMSAIRKAGKQSANQINAKVARLESMVDQFLDQMVIF